VALVIAVLGGAWRVVVTGDATAPVVAGERLVCQVVGANGLSVSLYCMRHDDPGVGPVYVSGVASTLLNRRDGLDCVAAISGSVALSCDLITRSPDAYTMPGYAIYIPLVVR
jgi:hypothetical protein